MKKIIITISLILCLIVTSANIIAIGDIQGEILHTDIKAYIDGNPIKSYNIDGWTGIMAEDLMDYGFEVIWDSKNRTLSVDKSVRNIDIIPIYQFEDSNKAVGSHAGYVYSTDIKTYVNDIEVPSFNIGGWTIIYIDELTVYGDVVWNAEKREISYSYSSPWSIVLTPENNTEHTDNIAGGITDISGVISKNNGGSFDISSSSLDHVSKVALESNKRYGGLRFTVSMNAHHLLNDVAIVRLFSEMITVRYDGIKTQETADVANNHTKILINDIPVKIKDVVQEKGNNKETYCFILDFDVAKEDIAKISFEIK